MPSGMECLRDCECRTASTEGDGLFQFRHGTVEGFFNMYFKNTAQEQACEKISRAIGNVGASGKL